MVLLTVPMQSDPNLTSVRNTFKSLEDKHVAQQPFNFTFVFLHCKFKLSVSN